MGSFKLNSSILFFDHFSYENNIVLLKFRNQDDMLRAYMLMNGAPVPIRRDYSESPFSRLLFRTHE